MTGPAPEPSTFDLGTTAGRLAERRRRVEAATNAAGQAGAAGRRARERIDALLDAGSFVETDVLAGSGGPDPQATGQPAPGPGVVTGHGTVDGRPVCVFSVSGHVAAAGTGSAGRKVLNVMDRALTIGCPLVGIGDGAPAGDRADAGWLGGDGELAYRNALASGVIPQLFLVMGACTGGTAYWAALADFTLMVEGASSLMLSDPHAIRTVTGEDVGLEELAGAHAHNARTGLAHFQAADEPDCLELARALLSYLPGNNLEAAPAHEPDGDPLAVTDEDLELDSLVPDSPHQPYEMRRVVEQVLDGGELLEVHALFARNVVCGFGRVDGRPVGVVANQPAFLAGALDADAARKAARFVRTCDAFNLPVVTFVDVPGFLPDAGQERLGLAGHVAKLAYAYAEATVPKVTVVTRRAYGAAYDVMGSKHLGADVNLAWPTARMAGLGPQAAVGPLGREDPATAPDPDARLAELARLHDERVATPYLAAGQGYLDDVIDPSLTRPRVVLALRLLRTKRESLPPKKHGNVPL